ncbi:MAG: hypothetical protein ACLQFR_20550 [Streptosporangiaceae bacterium]
MLTIRPHAALLAGLVPVLAFAPPAGQAGRTGATTSTSAAFQVRLRQHYGPAGNASDYSVIVAAGKRVAWVFGGTNPGGVSAPVAERWNGRTVAVARLPAGLTGFISDASAPSAHDVWAVSGYGGYVLHWSGRRWYVARRWRGGQITDVAAVTAKDVWVFGTTASGFAGTGTWHFDGKSWRKVPGPARAVFRASALSRRNMWAIAAGSRGDYVLHFDGSTWRRVRAGRLFNGVQLHDILALSNRDVWVAGNTTSRSGATSLAVYHWAGHGWFKVLTRRGALAGNLASGRDGTVLLTATPTSLAATGLIIQASVHGVLSATIISSPEGSGVSDATMVAGVGEIWASGGILTRLGGDATVWAGPVAHPADPRGIGDDLTAAEVARAGR